MREWKNDDEKVWLLSQLCQSILNFCSLRRLSVALFSIRLHFVLILLNYNKFLMQFFMQTNVQCPQSSVIKFSLLVVTFFNLHNMFFSFFSLALFSLSKIRNTYSNRKCVSVCVDVIFFSSNLLIRWMHAKLWLRLESVFISVQNRRSKTVKIVY